MLHRLPIGLLGIGALLGGPLWIFDAIRGGYGTGIASVLAGAPAIFMLFGALTALEDGPSRPVVVVVSLGAIGATVLLLMDVYVAQQLLAGDPHPNRMMIFIGLLFGFASVAAYGWLTRGLFG